MTPQEELERLMDLSGLKSVLTMLAVICDQRAEFNAVKLHNTAAAKEWAKYCMAIDAAIVKMWGRL